MEKQENRCTWAVHSPLEREYHDKEWGIPCHDDRKLFEMLILEGMQAGLSWSVILQKRAHMRVVFDGFDPEKIKEYKQEKIEQLMLDPGVIRNRLKLNSMVTNAKTYIQIKEKYGSLDRFLWNYVDSKPIVNHWDDMILVPANTELSDRISKDMKKLGFKFVGTTIIYALMQAVGMVNDHIISCFLHGWNGEQF